MWGMDDLEVQSPVTEAVDLLSGLNVPLAKHGAQFAPQLHLVKHTLTRASFVVKYLSKEIGYIEVAKYGAGCKIHFGMPSDEMNTYRGVYRAIRFEMSSHNLLADQQINDEWEHRLYEAGVIEATYKQAKAQGEDVERALDSRIAELDKRREERAKREEQAQAATPTGDEQAQAATPTGDEQDIIRKPQKPKMKTDGGKGQEWIDYYHALKHVGIATDLKGMAQESGFSHSYLRQLHEGCNECDDTLQ
jgi:hypothetical protein